MQSLAAATTDKESRGRLQNERSDLRRAPAHLSVYLDLRARVLFGDYAPGQPLTIQGLVQDTDAGVTPVREAIRRLIAEGGVAMRDNRRIEVPVLTRGDIDELLFMRRQIEPELARRAAPRITQGDLVLLVDADAKLNGAIQRGDIKGYLRQNHIFHHTLYAAAQTPILVEAVERLWLRFGPSLRVVCGRFGTMNLPDQHAEILSALEMGNADAAARAMQADVEQGMQQIALAADSIDVK